MEGRRHATEHAPERPASGPRSLQDRVGNAAIQSMFGERSKQAAFERGARGPRTSLPFRARVEAGFGRDFGDVEVHQGPEVDAALDEMGARGAFAGGTMLLERGAPFEVVAHEAAHAADAEGGTHLKPEAPLSTPGDPSERRADAMAEAVTAGRSADAGLERTRLRDTAPAGSARIHGWWTPEGDGEKEAGDHGGQSGNPVAVTDTLLFIQEGTGLLVIRAPASGDPDEIARAFQDVGASTCGSWQEVHPGDPTYPLFYALLRAREAGPSAVDYDALGPTIGQLVGQNVLAGGMMPGPWEPPGDQPIPFYIGNSAHVAIAQAYAAAHRGELVFTNFTPISSIVESMAEMGVAVDLDALSSGKGALRPDILNASERSIYGIKPEPAAATAVAEAAIYVAAFAEAGIVITLGAPGAPGTEGVLPAPDGFFEYWSPAPGAIVYRYTKNPDPDRISEPSDVPVEEPVEEPEFRPFSWDYWEEVTGLTGLALLVYLIVSEGSRIAFPPRNAVPVP